MIFLKSKEAVVFLFLFFTIAHSRLKKLEMDSPCISQNSSEIREVSFLSPKTSIELQMFKLK